MLSGILNSDKAISMNIAIMRAFVEIRKTLLLQTDLKEQLRMIREKIGDHDAQLNRIYVLWKTCWMKKQRKENGRKEIGSDLNSDGLRRYLA